MTFQDKPTFENVIFGHFYSTRLELTYILERALVIKCHNSDCNVVTLIITSS